MSKFVTSIKNNYTVASTGTSAKKEFTTPYSSKGGKKVVISGENRSIGKRYASQFVK